MTAENVDLKSALPELIARYDDRLPAVEAICAGSFPREKLQRLAARVYAEAKAAIQFKFADRIRICPLELGEIRRYWCMQLAEESGDFQPGQDHASLFVPVCLALGLTQDQLSHEYERYLPRIEYLRQSPISIDLTLHEVARLYVEEAVFVGQANRIGDALCAHYGVPEPALKYFRVHAILDVGHSAAALNVLVSCAKTEAHKRLVLESVTAAVERFPIWADDIHSA